jgi:hypothetical protein
MVRSGYTGFCEPDFRILIRMLYRTVVPPLRCINCTIIGCEGHFKGIVSWDFDSIFMILSYSFDVKLLPLDILFFSILMFSYSYWNYIIYDFFSLSCNPDLVAEFIQKELHILNKWRIFIFIFTLYPYWIFVQRDKLLNKKIQYTVNMKT